MGKIPVILLLCLFYPATCEEEMCNVTTVANTSVNTNQTTVSSNKTITYTCNADYQHIAGDLTRTCYNGSFDGTEPTCEVKMCNVTTVANASVNTNQTTVSSNETVTYTCNADYQHIAGDLTRTCYNGSFDGTEPTCEETLPTTSSTTAANVTETSSSPSTTAVNASETSTSSSTTAVNVTEISTPSSTTAVNATESSTPFSTTAVNVTESSTPFSTTAVNVTESSTPSSTTAVNATESSTPSSTTAVNATESSTPSSTTAVNATESSTPSSTTAVNVTESSTPPSTTAVNVTESSTPPSTTAVNATETSTPPSTTAVNATESSSPSSTTAVNVTESSSPSSTTAVNVTESSSPPSTTAVNVTESSSPPSTTAVNATESSSPPSTTAVNATESSSPPSTTAVNATESPSPSSTTAVNATESSTPSSTTAVNATESSTPPSTTAVNVTESSTPPSTTAVNATESSTPSSTTAVNVTESSTPPSTTAVNATESSTPSSTTAVNATESSTPSSTTAVNATESSTPSSTTAVNITESSTPSSTTAVNVTESSTPSPTTAGNVTESSTPSSTTAVNVTESASPVSTTAVNVTESSTPVSTTAGNVTESSTPVSTTAANVTESSTPVSTTAVNVIESSTPSSTTAANVTESSSPSSTTAANETESSSPSSTTAVNVTESSTPSSTTAVNETESSSPPSTTAVNSTESSSPPSTTAVNATESSSPPSTTAFNATESSSPSSTTAVNVTEFSSPSLTTAVNATESSSPPSTTAVNATESSSPPSTTAFNVTESSSPPSTTAVNATETSSPSSTTAGNVTESASPVSTTAGNVTESSTPVSTTAGNVTESSSPPSTTAVNATESSSPPSTTAFNVTESSSPPSTTAVNATETSSPSSTTAGNVTESASPVSTTAGNVTESSTPVSTTAGNVTESSTPVSTTAVNVTESSTPSSTTAVNVTESSTPSSTTAANVTESSSPSSTTAANETESSSPSSTTAVNVTESSTPSTTTAVNVTESSTPSSTTAVNETESSSPPSTTAVNSTESSSPPSTTAVNSTESSSPPSTTAFNATESSSPSSTTAVNVTEFSSPSLTTAVNATESSSPPSTTAVNATESSSPPSTTAFNVTESSSPPSTTAVNATESSSPSSTTAVNVTETSSPSSTTAVNATETSSPPSTTAVKATESSSPPSTTAVNVTESSTPSSTTAVNVTESSTPSSTTAVNVTESSSPSSTTAVNVTESSSPPSTTAVNVPPSTTAVNVTESSSPPSTTGFNVTESSSPPSTTAVNVTESSSPPSTTAVNVTESSSPPSTTAVNVTESSSPPSTTAVNVTESSSPPSTTAVNVTESSTPSSTTAVNVTESSLPPSTTAFNVTESSSPPSTTAVNVTESSTPSSTTAVNVTESSTPFSTTAFNVTESSSSPSTTAVNATESSTPSSTTAVNVTESSSPPSTTAVNATESSTLVSTTAVNVTESSTLVSTTAVNVTESSTPSSTTAVNVTESSMPSSTTAVNVTESATPSSTTAVNVTESSSPPSTTAVNVTETSSPSSTTAVNATESSSPPSTTAVNATESSLPPSTTAVNVTESSSPSSTTAVNVTESSSPPSTTAVNVTESSSPVSTTAVNVTESSTPSSTTAVNVTESSTPSSTTAVNVTESSTPSSTTAVNATESSTPSSTTVVNATESSTPPSTTAVNVTEISTPSSTTAVNATESSTPPSTTAVNVTESSTPSPTTDNATANSTTVTTTFITTSPINTTEQRSTPVSTAAPTTGDTTAPTTGDTASPTSGSTASPTSGSTAAPTSGSTGASTTGSTEAPTNGSTAAPTSGSTEAPTTGSTTGSTAAPTNGSTAAPTSGSTEAPTTESTAASTTGSTKAPTSGSTEAPTTGSTETPTTGSTAAPTFSSTASPTTGSTAAPTTSPVTVCTVPAVENAVNRPSNSQTVGIGVDVTFACNNGYKLVGNKTITCQAGGIFNGTHPTCTRITCAVPSVDNANISPDSQTVVFGASVTYTCNSGFDLSGAATITCSSDGTFGSVPSCAATTRANCGLHLAFGTSAGDTTSPKSDDSCRVEIATNYNIPFILGAGYRRVYICPNGLMCFGRKYEGYTIPQRNRVVNSEFTGSFCLAPYFTDLNPNSAGDVFYQVYDSLSSDVNQTVYAKVKALVEAQYATTNFLPQYIVKATWDQIPRFGGPTAETVTFQAIYTTDGTHAYALYSYQPGGMKFENGDQFIGYINNGYAFGEFDTSTNGSFLRRPDKNLELGASGCIGGATYDVSVDEAALQNSRLKCLAWHKKESGNRQYYINQLNRMPLCPCFIEFMWWDPRFSVWDYEWQNGYEVISIPLFPSRRGGIYPNGKNCVYNWRTWSFIGSGKSAGTFTKYSPLVDRRLNALEDRQYKRVCCDEADLCEKYWDVRPVARSCYTRSPFTLRARGSGDPHINTLDGKGYTFNGHGEYQLLKIPSSNLTIQSRTDRAVKADGNASEATVFSGFAIQGDEVWAQAELNATKTGILLFVGNNKSSWSDFTDTYNNETAEVLIRNYEGITVSVSRNDSQAIKTSISIVLSDLGVTFNVSLGSRLLQMGISMNADLKNKDAVGLLGNYNDDPDDDLVPREGNEPITDTSESNIFRAFGQTWMTTEAESIFKYDEGITHNDFSHPEFTPQFLEEANQTMVQEANTTCNGNIQCIFDFVFTGDRQLALQTGSTEELADEAIADASNVVPNITVVSGLTTNDETGQHFLHVEKDTEASFIVNGEDDGTITYEFADNTDNVATFSDPASGNGKEIKFTLSSLDVVKVSVFVRDDKNVTSSEIEVTIIYCNGCTGNGQCNYNSHREGEGTDSFRIAVCDCPFNWEGNDCETDFDGCATDPCAIGQNCSDVSATGHTENGPAYNCSECPDGYTVVGTKCEDIDECNTTTPCDSNSVCTNTPGSYYCTCNMGFRLSTSNRTVCLDINECNEATSGCDQICNNTVGSFECSCFPGFNLTGSACTAATPPDACNAINCSGAVGCTTDADNDARCFCNAGYSLIAGNNTCTDTNECDNGPCSQTCSNSEGSFSCSCLTGYKLGTDRVSCTQCPYPTFGENCASTCQCGRGANRCDSVRGCICNSGWQGVNCDGDINECNTPNVCNDANKECANTIGSYTCSCRSGYYKDANGTCQDVNECESDQLNTCEQTCTNSPGSFVCSCNTGYNVDPGNALRCVDYDECDAGVSGCQQKCLNSVGRFSCECYFGYRLNDDRKTCYQVQDVCAAEFPDFGCSHICKVENQQAFCLCETGYELSTDNKTCIDINECLTSGSCSDTATCTNKDGGYDCACPRGKKLANDKRTCTVCDSNHYGDNCALECNCGVGSSRCDSQTGCVCKSDGWIGAKCDQDTDECAIGTHNCTGTNEQCRNTPGSFVCECLPGYQRNAENICEDIEECIIPSLNTCSQQCENVPGSFTCSCHDGFTESGNSCNDVNECSTSTHGCGQTCENTIGSYRCTCNDGYRLDLTDFKTCIPSNVCSNSSYCSDNADCANNDGTDTCTCHTGFKFVSGSVTICEDIKECDSVPCTQLCIERIGSFECVCNQTGFKLDADATTCIECPQGEYGPNCTESCACTEANTDRCDPIDGTCNCKPGYNLTDCSNDINECKDGSAVCPTNSECSNIPGSYVCNCKSGYLKTATGQCQECSNGKFGENCAQTCACNMTNTDSCDKVTGNCQCKPVWNGTTCNEDVDECNMGGPGPCAVKKNTTCNNTYGSYECNCVSGYQEDATGCVDINECLTQSGLCNQDCVNTPGLYTCVCSPGFSGDGETCTLVTCNVSNVPNAIANQSVVDVNNSVTYECNTTYVHTAGDLTRWCLANGTLNGTEPVCSVVTCNVSNVPNAIANQSVVDINKSVTYECNTTYVHTAGDLTRWCLANGTLNGTEPVCSVVTCNVSNVPNAIANQSVVDINNSITYECNTTYIHTGGDLTRWCLANGTLNGTEPRCSVVTCNVSSVPNAIANQSVVDINNSVTYECNTTYYHKAGDLTRWCLTNGTLNGTEPVCSACSGNTYGDSCNNMCDCATDHAETSEQTCNHTTGACMCRAQWGGSRCEIDVDECADPLLNNCTAQNKYCHNIIGGYNCSCLRNYQENSNGTCVLFTATTTTLAPEEDGIEVFIVFQIPATTLQNVNFSIASTFQKWADDVGQTLLKYYMATMGNRVKRVNVFHIEIGSLKVNATIIKEDSEEAAQLLSQATSELDNVMLEVNGENYTATASALAGVQIDHNADSAKLLCDLYILDRGSCGDKQVCVVINTKPVCQPMKDDDNLDLVLGLGIGFPLFFLLAIVIFLVIKLTLKRRQQKRRFYTEEGMGISGFPNNGFFPTAMPTKINTWGRNDSAYRPQEWEEESSTSSGSSDDVRRKRKYKDRDNYGETQVHDHQPSMFSWDFMYNYINPNEPYRIQRPQYRPQP
ncbi:mucin-4-like [Mya arenaria]|uniref:mucin-4-like n=1 Tax=Mya arenaria TaxID=6604 RepID=UPI0022E523CF|nr:mucin-4-like [Mya arenaria]